MDVIANNLANVNTVGFKKSRADFQDLLYQEMRPAGAAVAQGATVADRPGSRPGRQARLDRDHVRPGNAPEHRQQHWMSPLKATASTKSCCPTAPTAIPATARSSATVQGKLVNSDGYAIQPEITIPADATSIAIGKDGTVSITRGSSNTPESIGKITLTRFSNPAGLEHLGGNNFRETAASGNPTDGTPGQAGFGPARAGHIGNVQCPDRAGDGQHDHRPARL